MCHVCLFIAPSYYANSLHVCKIHNLIQLRYERLNYFWFSKHLFYFIQGVMMWNNGKQKNYLPAWYTFYNNSSGAAHISGLYSYRRIVLKPNDIIRQCDCLEKKVASPELYYIFYNIEIWKSRIIRRFSGEKRLPWSFE